MQKVDMTEFLQKILKANLFDIGDHDTRLEQLKNSINDLVETLEKDTSLIPVYTLATLDPNTSDTEQVFIDTEIIITKHWEALRVRHNEMPKNIIRGVIIAALYQLGKNNSITARIIYLTGINFFPYLKLGSEKDIVQEMLLELSEIAEKNAIEEWGLTNELNTFKLPTLKINDFKFGEFKLNKNQLKTDLTTAIGNNSGGYGSNHGGASAWGPHYASNASEGINEFVKDALVSFSSSLSPTSIETPINKFFTDFKKSLDEILNKSFSQVNSIRMRSDILWWKESFYSESYNDSYRNLNEFILPFAAARDLYFLVPKTTPISVDYLLKEVLFLVSDKNSKDYTFKSLLEALNTKEIKEVLSPLFKNISTYKGKISLIDFITLLINDKVKISDFKSRTGIDGKEKITNLNIAIWIFHDLMVKHLIEK
ncbi:GTPase-associated system all-helical protein GASH [Chryseobacterium sp. SIMBA_028]|uniref:GTPase-associated system all-helical protein GASH n=2 Tax=unclassified Chryseobacterium TaxID=2593645 RepID=UPI003979116E